MAIFVVVIWIVLGLIIWRFIQFIYRRNKKLNFNHRIILITGASSGIGEEYSIKLSQYENTKLILLSNEMTELIRVKMLCKHPENVTVYDIDLSNEQATRKICSEIASNRFSRNHSLFRFVSQ